MSNYVRLLHKEKKQEVVNFPPGYKPFDYQSEDQSHYKEILEDRDYWKSLCENLVEAIENEGPRPWRHHDVMMSHRYQWPTLWSRIDKIIEATHIRKEKNR